MGPGCGTSATHCSYAVTGHAWSPRPSFPPCFHEVSWRCILDLHFLHHLRPKAIWMQLDLKWYLWYDEPWQKFPPYVTFFFQAFVMVTHTKTQKVVDKETLWARLTWWQSTKDEDEMTWLSLWSVHISMFSWKGHFSFYRVLQRRQTEISVIPCGTGVI